MVVFINGSFGIGKTTVARLLVRHVSRSTIFDPEPLGLVLAQLARFLPLKERTDDFQDLRAWRRGCVRAIQVATRIRSTVIVPMTFSNASYLAEMVSPFRGRGVLTLHYCLTAPPHVVLERLQGREGRRGPSAWQLRRLAECCAAHQGREFAEQVPTDGRSASDLAMDLAGRIRRATEDPHVSPAA
jgi:thymidylate kinase